MDFGFKKEEEKMHRKSREGKPRERERTCSLLVKFQISPGNKEIQHVLRGHTQNFIEIQKNSVAQHI